MSADKLDTLIARLDVFDRLVLAVSGGVDSMVLAHVAARFSRVDTTVVHAVSPAVPAAATARVLAHATRHGWHLEQIDAGELADPAYRANPVDRCFFCKQDLYGSIAARFGGPIASGTNVDDLSDYRPGLEAARRHGVVHPFVEAGFAKRDIYTLATALDLGDLAALPAQPCLASRIETGIPVDAAGLGFIETVETALAGLLPVGADMRCRITAAGVHVECSPLPEGDDAARVAERVQALCGADGRNFLGVRPYRRGSAFLRAAGDGATPA